MNTPESLSLDARTLSARQINDTLSTLQASISTIEIENCSAPDLLAAGFNVNCRVSMKGNLGDYCLCSISNAEMEVHGRAGCGLGESMESGSIVVHGDTGDATGAFNRGGFIAVYGNTGRRTATGMCGGDIVVKGSIGAQGAFAMTDGALLVFGAAGAMLGHRMTGGTIYIRGEVESITSHIEASRLRESDRLRIGLLLLKAGLTGDAKDFRVLKAVGS